MSTAKTAHTVYLLQHVHEHKSGNEDVKLIGIYSSIVRAKSAKRRIERLPGFKDCAQGFNLEPYRLDEDHWTEGFVDGTS
jgi:hypothetical protein